MRVAISLILSLCLLCQATYAGDWVYPRPPATDTSVYCCSGKHKPAKPKRHRHRRHHYKYVHIRYYSYQRAYYHPRYHRRTGLFVYYGLPAPACCGGSQVLPHCQCCVEPGVWHKNRYATFRAAPEDLVYSATNTDDPPKDDAGMGGIIDDSVDDPR